MLKRKNYFKTKTFLEKGNMLCSTINFVNKLINQKLLLKKTLYTRQTLIEKIVTPEY